MIEWDLGPNKNYDTKAYKAQLVKNVESPAEKAAERGDIEQAFANAKHKISATYTGGHLSHSPMEPNASLVLVQEAAALSKAVNAPAQLTFLITHLVSKMFALKPEKPSVTLELVGTELFMLFSKVSLLVHLQTKWPIK